MESDQKAAKTGPAATQFKPGNRANPGGLTAEEREARDAMRKALSSDGMREQGLAAYKRLLDSDNPLIVKDFMDRVAGKVKERVEVEPGENALPGWAKDATLSEVLEIVRSGK